MPVLPLTATKPRATRQYSSPLRRSLLSLPLLLLLAPPSASAGVTDSGPPRNTAVLRALRARESALSVSSGDVTSRLEEAVDALNRSRTLAAAGGYAGARQLLRKGGMSRVRTDAAALAARGWDATVLDAYDDALRVAERGGTADGVKEAGDAVALALAGLLSDSRGEVGSAPSDSQQPAAE